MMTVASRPGLASAIVRYRWLIAVVWAIVAVMLIPRATTLSSLLETGAQVRDSESARVSALLAGPLKSAFADYVVLVVSGIPSPASEGGAATLGKVVTSVRAMPGVAGAFSYLDMPDTMLIGKHGTGALVLVGLKTDSSTTDLMIPALRERTAAVAAQLSPEYPALRMRWTGQGALNVDLRVASARDVQTAERRALPVVAVMLLVAFGAIVAAVIPLVTGALAITIALGASAVAAGVLPMSILLQSVVPMLGLGLGIDYALLMVSRFRDALAGHGDAHAAAIEAAEHAGHTILLSAATVALGFLVLLSVPLNEMRAIAVGGLLVVTACAALTTTLLPGLLAALGTRIDWGRVRRPGSRQNAAAFWRRWGMRVTARPWTALLVGALPLVLLSLQAGRLRTGLPNGDWLPASMESTRALKDLETMGRGGVVQGIRVVVLLPETASLWEQSGWAAIARYGRQLAGHADIARVRSVVGAAEAAGLTLRTVLTLPGLSNRLARGLASADGRRVLIEVMPKEGLSAEGAVQLARELRRLGPSPLGIHGATVLVGGLPALNADYQDAVAGRFVDILSLIIGGTFVALLVGFRSVLVPIKAVLLNLLSVAAAFGAVTLVFQDGHGASLLGVHGELGAVFSSVPMIVFCITFGLSMDYEVFLLTRVREGRLRGLSDREAIIEGLGHTGQVITSAAAIMLAVFAAFMFSSVLVIKMLGFALALTVLLDATIVRMVLGPALLQLAGRWNWWPARAGVAVSVPRGAVAPSPVAHNTFVVSD